MQIIAEKYLFRSLVLAAAYALFGSLGLTMALPPSYASPFFPAAGIALAAVYIDGPRMLPALMIGILLMRFSNQQTALFPPLLNFLLSFPPLIQAVAGSSALKRFVGSDCRLDTGSEISRFALVVIFTSLINSILSVSMTGFSLQMAVSWWVGDVLGTLLFFPLTMIFIGAPEAIWFKRMWSVGLPVFLMVCVVTLSFVQSSRWEQKEASYDSDRSAAAIRHRITDSLDSRKILLREISTFYLHNSQAGMTGSEFREYGDEVKKNHPSLLSIEWIPGIPDRHPDGRIGTGIGEMHFPVTFADPPDDRNLGFDLSSSRATLARIGEFLKTDRVLSGPPIRLHGNETALPMLLARHAQDGKIIVALVLTDTKALLERLSLPLEDFHVDLVDLESGVKLFDSFPESLPKGEGLKSAKIFFGGRSYLIESAPTQNFLDLHRKWYGWGLGTVGTFTASLLCGLLLLSSGYHSRLAREVSDRTADLAESEQRYRSLFDGSMVPMLLIDPESGKLEDANAAASRYYGHSRNRLKGMRITDLNFLAEEEVEREMRTAATEGRDHFYFPHRLASGEIRDVEVHSGPIRIRGKTLLYSIIHDVTERLQDEARLKREKENLELLMQTSGDGIHVFDMQGNILAVNDKFCEMLGYSKEELLGMNVSQWDANFSGEELGRKIEENFRIPNLFETCHRRKDGKLIQVEISAKAVVFDGRLALWNAARDITARKISEDELRLAASVYQNSNEGMMVTDAENRIVSVNPAFTSLTGYEAEEAIGRTPAMLRSGKHSKEFYKEMWESLNRTGRWHGEIWNRNKSGELYAEYLSINVIHHEDGTVHRYVSLFSDITDQKRKEDLIWKQANFDSLTGLPNRRLFHERLSQEIAKAERSGHSIALLFIDLDRFKEVNDTLGHAKGDVLLQEASRRIGQCLRQTDTVARLGGDEFTVLLPESGESLGIQRIADKIIRELSRPFDLEDGDVGYISASVGITLYPQDAADPATLLSHADQAMYAAKTDGKNRFSYFTPSMQKEARNRLDLTNELRGALERGELEIHYQPIVELSTGEIHKAEALLRWRHPERGMIPPATFIPLAEESGIIHEIGRWVLEQSAAASKRWRERYGLRIQISVNRSPVQFELFEPCACEDITIEITEGLLLGKSEKVKKALHALHESGMEISIDDFGTGFSSLSYLKQFEIDYLKIDRSFIQDLEEDESDQALTEAIILMAHKLNLKTIAEGVEKPGQHDRLLHYVCDLAQGFLYSPAVAEKEFESILRMDSAWHWRR